MWYCGKNRVWSGSCLHTIMCLTHACRIPPSSTAVLLLKKEGGKNPTSLEKKQIVPNLVTLDIWQVLITMVRFDVLLDLCFRGFYKEEYCYRATDSAGNKTKPTEQSLLRCLQVEKGKWGAQWFDFMMKVKTL